MGQEGMRSTTSCSQPMACAMGQDGGCEDLACSQPLALQEPLGQASCSQHAALAVAWQDRPHPGVDDPACPGHPLECSCVNEFSEADVSGC